MTSDERKTDPSGLAPPSLPPGYYAVPSEVLEYIIGRLQAIDAALFMLATKADFDAFREEILTKPAWVTEFTDEAVGIVSRVEALEKSLDTQVGICRYHHGNGGDPRPPWE